MTTKPLTVEIPEPVGRWKSKCPEWCPLQRCEDGGSPYCVFNFDTRRDGYIGPGCPWFKGKDTPDAE
jgi:hypothetical protein